MISNLYLISLSKIVLVWLIMYILIILINYKNRRRKKKFGTSEEIKNDRLLTLIYLDQFFITNKFYTFFMLFLYIFGIIIIFIIIRYILINDVTQLLPQESLYTRMIQVLFAYGLLFITLVLYRSLLIIICKKEVDKFYLYIKQFSWMITLRTILEYKLGDRIFGSLYLIFYRISTLEYKYPFYGREFEKAHRFILDDELDYIINNYIIINSAYLATNYARKYAMIQKLFKVLAYISRFCFKHVHKVNELFSYFILMVIFCIELYNKEFHYIYLTLFICLLIRVKRDLLEYLYSRASYYDGMLANYFYINDISYEKQRGYIYMKNNINISKSFDSEDNNRLFRSLDDIIDYAFKDFKNNDDYSEVKKEKRRNNGIYRRFYVLIGFLFVSCYLLLINSSVLLLLLPTIIILYCHSKTYYVSNYEEIIDYEKYTYSRKNNIMFWILVTLQGYIFWLLLLKPELIFMDTEVLLKLPSNMGKFVKIYSIDEKIMYLYNYFEFYINLIDNETLNKDYLRYILRQINFKDLIDNNVRLKDIQVYVKLLIDNYYFNESIYKMLEEHINNNIIEEYMINPWYIFMRNILFLGAVTFTLIYNKNIWLITKQISTSEGVFKLIKDIYSGTIKNKLTYEMLVNVIMKIFK